MNHDILKTIIFDQHAIIQRSKIVPRQYRFDPEANYVVTGIRRAGKSMLLYGQAQELVRDGLPWNRVIYINFEDERLSEMTVSDLQDIVAVQSELSEERGVYFFDEIQNVPGWERFARRLADAGERVYITGSNAKMLSREMASALGGRYQELYVLPYSFSEYLDARGITHSMDAILATHSAGRIAAAALDYLSHGGFPESLRMISPREYVSNVYQKILLGDIVARNHLKNNVAMQLLVKKVAESVMQETSYSRLHNTLKTIGLNVTKDSIIDYIGFAKDAYLLFTVKNWFSKFAEREAAPKYYFTDNGLLNLFLIQKDSALLENLVAIELMRRYGEQVWFAHSAKTGIDVDFVLPEAQTAVQVCLSLNDTATEREIDSLVRLADTTPEFEQLWIITRGEQRRLERNGHIIQVLALPRFLLEKPEPVN